MSKAIFAAFDTPSTAKKRRPAEYDIIAANHKFLFDDKNYVADTLENQLLKKYHDQLFKEYCIGDLTHYKTNQVALRWRTKKEVVSGKGEHTCGNRECNSKDQLKSWEVNFKYIEQGQKQNALVKLRLCPECSVKLNYTKNKHKPSKKESHAAEIDKSKESSHAKGDSDRSPAHKSDNDKENNSLWGMNDDENTEMTLEQRMEAYLLDLL